MKKILLLIGVVILSFGTAKAQNSKNLLRPILLDKSVLSGVGFHYELSVIATSRANSSLTKTNPQHQLFDKSILSGNSIVLDKGGLYEKVLEKGAELTVLLKAERPGEKLYKLQEPEKIIHILSGQIEFTDSLGKQHQFYTGDLFYSLKVVLGSGKAKDTKL